MASELSESEEGDRNDTDGLAINSNHLFRRQEIVSKPTKPQNPQTTINERQKGLEAETNLEDDADTTIPYEMQRSPLQNSNLSRANSVFSLSRASLTNQLSQLNLLKLPETSSLLSSIDGASNARLASELLNDFAEQLKCWEQKAMDVLAGLDADNDVEWAAAGGKEGLNEVDDVIKRFEQMVNVYVTAIDQVQTRNDISDLSAREIQTVVSLMEQVLEKWKHIKRSFQKIKEQVEIAMEWEELWNTVLAEIGLELKSLNRLIFEMEEHRYRTTMAGETETAEKGTRLDELESMVEDGNRYNEISEDKYCSHTLSPTMIETQIPSRNAQIWHEDANLLALFARMQPLRASLDFLPMRLSVFRSRGVADFPCACEDLDSRRNMLESQWKNLESDAEALRKELGEDRWIIVFRNAGRQMLKMCESIMKSITKLRELLAGERHPSTPRILNSRIESFEAKRTHYGAAVEHVLTIVDRGIADRFTINGEILRLQQEMKQRWANVESAMAEMDEQIERANLSKTHQLRDSVSTVLSTDRSVSGSTIDTPNSSPASSIVISSRINSDQIHAVQQIGKSCSATSHLEASPLQESTNNISRDRVQVSQLGHSSIPRRSYITQSPPSSVSGEVCSSQTRPNGVTPRPRRVERLSSSTAGRPDKPRWNSSTNTNNQLSGNSSKLFNTSSPCRKGNRVLHISHIPVSRCSSTTSSPTCTEALDSLESPLSLRGMISYEQENVISPRSSLGLVGSPGRLKEKLAIASLGGGKDGTPRLRGQVSTSSLSGNSKQQWSGLTQEPRCGSAANNGRPMKKDNINRYFGSGEDGRHSSMLLRPKTRVSSEFASSKGITLSASAGSRPRWR